MEAPHSAVSLPVVDISSITATDIEQLGETALAHCLKSVLERDPDAEPESPRWSSFISS
jgi:hypothetical protein